MVADIPEANASNYPFRQLWVDGARAERAQTFPATSGLGGNWSRSPTGYTTSGKIDGISGWVGTVTVTTSASMVPLFHCFIVTFFHCLIV